MNKKILCLLVSLLLAIPLFGAREKKSEVKVTKPSTSVSKEENKKDVTVKKDKEVITSENRLELIVLEDNLHTRRMTQIDRLSEICKNQKNDKLLARLEKLRNLEIKRHEKRLAKIGNPEKTDKKAKSKKISKEQAKQEVENLIPLNTSKASEEIDKIQKEIESEQ